MRRAVLASIISMTLAFFTVGCGAPASESPADTTDGAQNAIAVGEEKSVEEEPVDDEKAVEEEPENEPQEVEQEEEQVSEYEKPYERGVVDGEVYRNAMFGMGFSLPEGFFFLTDEEMADVHGEPADLYTDEGISERLGEGSFDGSMYCDMFAILEDDAFADNLMFVIWKAPSSMYFTYSMYQAENYRNDEVKAYNSASEDSADQFEAVATNVTVDGEEWPALDLTRTNKDDGSVMYQRIVYLKCGFHYGRIIMTADTIEDLDEMTAHLSVL